jgi:hypothetical protein
LISNAAFFALAKAGNRIPINNAIMLMTTSSSIRVNPEGKEFEVALLGFKAFNLSNHMNLPPLYAKNKHGMPTNFQSWPQPRKITSL